MFIGNSHSSHYSFIFFSGYTFIAPLKHDLYGTQILIPPGFKLTFTLTKAQNGWFLMVPQDSNNTERYQFVISSCVLFAKVVCLNDNIYRSLKSRFETEKILYHHRRLGLKTETLNSHSISHTTNNLFPDSQQPLRVYFMLVNNLSMQPNYELNPFAFVRALKVQPKPTLASNITHANDRLQILQMAMIKEQQDANRQILMELKRMRKKRKQRKLRRLYHYGLRRKRSKQILQTDGNDTDEPKALQEAPKVLTIASKSHIKGKGKGKCTAKTATPDRPHASLNEAPSTAHAVASITAPHNDMYRNPMPTTSAATCQRTAAKHAVKRLLDQEETAGSEDSEWELSSDFESSEEESFSSDLLETSSEENKEQLSSVYETSPESVTNTATQESAKLQHSIKQNSLKKKNRQDHANSIADDPDPNPAPDPDPEYCFVQSFELDINSKPIDQFSGICLNTLG